MARIRSVKPALRTSRTVATWKFEVRYFWVLLWGYLDDLGRGLDIPKAIAGDCFPLDDNVTPATVNRWLDVIASTKTEPDKDPPLCRYQVGGRRYIHSVYWSEHQRPNRPGPSMHPPCPTHEVLSEPLTESRNGQSVSRHVLEFEGLTVGEVEGLKPTPERLTSPPSARGAKPTPCDRCGQAVASAYHRRVCLAAERSA